MAIKKLCVFTKVPTFSKVCGYNKNAAATHVGHRKLFSSQTKARDWKMLLYVE